jgi:hypothetical protein
VPPVAFLFLPLNAACAMRSKKLQFRYSILVLYEPSCFRFKVEICSRMHSGHFLMPCMCPQMKIFLVVSILLIFCFVWSLCQLFQVLLVLATMAETQWSTVSGSYYCKDMSANVHRPHSVTITEFGAVGDGATLNTKAFQNAIFYLNSFADKGGAQLFVPAGRWLTGSFSLISHLTLSLDKDAVIIGSPVR